MIPSWQRGLYVITDPELIASPDLASRVDAAISGGAVLVQYRDKANDNLNRAELASAILRVCRNRGVPLIINDDIALAVAIGADGIHLGHADSQLEDARQQLGAHAIIGASCYNEMSRAVAAVELGADYIAFGRFFASRTKPNAVQADIDILSRARRRFHIPVVAIGGITADNGAALISAGADILAVIHGVFGQDDTETAARSIAILFADKTVNRRSNSICV